MNEKVYVVSYYDDIECVFSKENLAKEYCDRFNNGGNSYAEPYIYEEYIIDEKNGL